jgi:hypothetical protein
MDTDKLLARLAARCEKSTMTAVAEELGISKQYLCDVLKLRRSPGPKVLAGMGLDREVTFRRAVVASSAD